MPDQTMPSVPPAMDVLNDTLATPEPDLTEGQPLPELEPVAVPEVK